VTYDGNESTGGDVPVDGNEYTTGDLVTVLGNTGVLVKRLRVHRMTTTVDGANVYTEGSPLVMGHADVTLYAKWRPLYSVTMTVMEFQSLVMCRLTAIYIPPMIWSTCSDREL